MQGVGTAGLAVSSGDGVTINAGADDTVHLRGLAIEGLGTGTNGIVFNTGGNLEIENCVIRNFANSGIRITPSLSSTFSVSNTSVSKNGDGIFVEPTAVIVRGTLSKVTANDNSIDGITVSGFGTTGSNKVAIGDSEASNNNDDRVGR